MSVKAITLNLLATLLLCAGAAVAGRAAGRKQTAAKPAAKSAAKPSSRSATASRTRKTTKRKAATRVQPQKAPTPARITEIQTALASQGAYKAAPNGKWDADTISSMKQFQSAHGLTPTGKIDALSLQKLGLGSETAGLGAPVTPAQAPAAAVSQPQPSAQ